MTAWPVVRRVRRGVARAVWAARFRRRDGTRTALASLRAQQWLTPRELKTVQNRKLARLIAHAYAHVPYYRRVMTERGIRPEHIRSAEDLVLLPLLTRDVIQERLVELRAERAVDRPHLIRANHTGGSTGTPLTFYQDEDYRTWGTMDLVRNYEMCGYRLGDPIAFLWGSDYDARPHRTVRGKLQNVIENRLFLDAFDSDEQDLIDFARQLAAFSPRLLVGYASSLALLARVIEAHGLRGVRPAAIQSSAEVLTPSQRTLLEQTFGCEVFDRYGCREVGNIAHECASHQGLHMLADNNIVEILGDDPRARPGDEGQIAVTNLNNLANAVHPLRER